MMKKATAEIITIGSELLLGQIVDTNSAYLASALKEIGLETLFQATVGDHRGRMKSVLRRALSRSQVVITTGGIGPTEDDLTREVAAEVFQKRLVFHPKLFRHIQSLFERSGFVMAPNNRKQAYIPAGARVVPNPAGTAPGFILEGEKDRLLIVLPGVPRELKRMMEETVLPYLKRRLPTGQGVIQYKVLKVCGLGESRVDEQIGDLIRGSKNPTLGLLASLGEIKIRITAQGRNKPEAQGRIFRMEEEIRKRLGILIFGQDEDTLEGVVCGLLADRERNLAVIETFTAGRISQRLLSVGSPGFKGGIVLPGPSPWPFPKPPLEQEKMSYFLAAQVRKWAGADLGLAAWVENMDDRQTLFLTLTDGRKKASQSYRIGGFAETLAERVTVIALDWVRRELWKKRKNVSP